MEDDHRQFPQCTVAGDLITYAVLRKKDVLNAHTPVSTGMWPRLLQSYQVVCRYLPRVNQTETVTVADLTPRTNEITDRCNVHAMIPMSPQDGNNRFIRSPGHHASSKASQLLGRCCGEDKRRQMVGLGLRELQLQWHRGINAGSRQGLAAGVNH